MTTEQIGNCENRTLWVFPKYSRKGASSRLRVHQFQDTLENAGYRLHISPLFDDEYLERLYSKEKTSTLTLLSYYLKRARMLLRVKRGEVVLVQGELFPWLPAFVDTIFLRGTKLILDFDDAIFHRYDLNRYLIVRFLLGRKIDRLMRSSQLVISGNRYLADRAEVARAAMVERLPTVVDIERYSPDMPPKQSAPLVVGWIGTPITWSTYGETLFQRISDALQDEKVEFLVVGASDTAFRSGRTEFAPWSEDTEAKSISRMSIGLMPLSDSPWAQGKCGYKLIQYLASGIPVIASPVGANLDIVVENCNGFFANSTDDWVDAVARFVRSPSLRLEMGIRGREMVRDKYSLQSEGPRLLQMINEVFEL